MKRRSIGVALAGGGPLGAIYEIGALMALDEALRGVSLKACDVYVGVSSGAFFAAGLANGVPPRSMFRLFIESDLADDPFEPSVLMRPALAEYGSRIAALPRLLAATLRSRSDAKTFPEALQTLTAALPTGLFDNAGIGDYLTRLFSDLGRSNDFRKLRAKLFIVATDLDSCQAVPFGAQGYDDVPISRAVQASAALPGLYPPVEINGRHYVDGALRKTLHASVALDAGARLLLCINPLVPFDADLAGRPASLVEGGLPVVLSQTFRSIIYSRMQIGMERYRRDYPDADVLLFEPARDDREMFFANPFSYADRRRLCEHAYQRTREDLRRRRRQLEPILARHGIILDAAVLGDKNRTLLPSPKACANSLANSMHALGETLDRLEALLEPQVASR